MKQADVPPIVAPVTPPTSADAKKLTKELEADKGLASEKAASIEDEKDKLISDKIKLYQEAVAENASPDVIEELERKLGMNSEEIKLHIAREEYVEQYKKNKKEHRKQLSIDKVKAGILNIFAKGEENKKKIKEEDYFNEEYKNAKESYDQARRALEAKLCREKKFELEKDGSLTDQQREEAFLEYKATEVICKVYVEEKRKLAKQKTEGSPVKPYWKQALNWYVGQNKYVRMGINTLLFTGVAFGTGTVGVAGALSYAGYKLGKSVGRSFLIGGATSMVVQGIDIKNRKKDEAFAEDQKAQREILSKQFAVNNDLKKYDEEMLKLEEAEKKRLRKRAITKIAVGITMSAVLGGATELLASGHLGINLGLDNTEKPEVPTAEVVEKPEVPDTAVNKAGFFGNLIEKIKDKISGVDKIGDPDHVNQVDDTQVETTVEETETVEDTGDQNTDSKNTEEVEKEDGGTKNTEETTKETAEKKESEENTNKEQEAGKAKAEQEAQDKIAKEKALAEEKARADAEQKEARKVTVEVERGHGAIQTIQELQDKLEKQYPNIEDRSESIKHILGTDADKLAVEYGMFKPGEEAESAMFKVGGKFDVDGDGNVKYFESANDGGTLLAKGTEAQASGTYAGKMIDSDNSGSKLVAPEKVSEFDQAGTKGDAPEKINTDNIKVEEKPLTEQEAPEKIEQGDKLPEQTTPEKVNPNIQVEEQPLNNRQVPEEVLEADKARAAALAADTDNGIKSNLTAGRNEDIAPLKGKWDNSNGTNTGTISPTRGSYTGGGGETIVRTGSSEIQNDELTPDGRVPMTDAERNQVRMRNEFLRQAKLDEARLAENGLDNRSGTNEVSMNKIEADPRHLEDAKEIRDTFGRSNVVIDKPDTGEVNNVARSRAIDDLFEKKNLKFNTYGEYEAAKIKQNLLVYGAQYDAATDGIRERVGTGLYNELPEWDLMKKLPASRFFDLNTQTEISTQEMQELINKGIVVGVEDPSGGLRDISFRNEAELERMAKLYERIDPLNAKPIGDEPLEKYINRITRDIHRTDDGTLYALKKDADVNELALDRNEFKQETVPTSRGMQSGRTYTSVRQGNYQNPNPMYADPVYRKITDGFVEVIRRDGWGYARRGW